jgi:hypothetical protein
MTTILQTKKERKLAFSGKNSNKDNKSAQQS